MLPLREPRLVSSWFSPPCTFMSGDPHVTCCEILARMCSVPSYVVCCQNGISIPSRCPAVNDQLQLVRCGMVKVKFTLEQATKAQSGIRGIALPFL